MQKMIRWLQQHAQRWWYPYLVAGLAFADHFVIVIPTDGLLLSAVALNPRRWVSTFLIVSIGSSLGALALALAVHDQGLPLLLQISPGIEKSWIWLETEEFMKHYGLLALFGIALSPFMQVPAVALAAMANIAITKIFFVVLLGRFIKYGIFCWIASHAPHLLKKLWGVREEIKEVQEASGEPLLLEVSGDTPTKN